MKQRRLIRKLQKAGFKQLPDTADSLSGIWQHWIDRKRRYVVHFNAGTRRPGTIVGRIRKTENIAVDTLELWATGDRDAILDARRSCSTWHEIKKLVARKPV